jgi:hypothetical protein
MLPIGGIFGNGDGFGPDVNLNPLSAAGERMRCGTDDELFNLARVIAPCCAECGRKEMGRFTILGVELDIMGTASPGMPVTSTV